jgi:hypothetical protein
VENWFQDTPRSIMLVSHLIRVPNSRCGGNEFEFKSLVRRGRIKVERLFTVPNSRCGGNEFEFESLVRRGRIKVERSFYKIIPNPKQIQAFCMTQRLLQASEGGGWGKSGRKSKRRCGGGRGIWGCDGTGRTQNLPGRGVGGGEGGGGHLRRTARETPTRPATSLPPCR